MIQSITKKLSNSQQSVDGGRNAYGSNAPESTVSGLLRVYKQKKCLMCNKFFRPTSGNQLFCGNLTDKKSCSYKVYYLRLLELQKRKKLNNRFLICKKCNNKKTIRISPTGKNMKFCLSCNPPSKKRTKNKTKEEIAGRKKPIECEVCGSVGTICFDHDHKTGLFRGWICNRCNWVLGFSKDDVGILKKLISYLEHQRLPKWE